MAPLPASFAADLWPATKAMFQAFVFPSLGFSAPPWVLTPLLVFGVFLVTAGSLAGTLAKGKRWAPVAWAAGAAAAAWVLFGAGTEVAAFFVVITLVLGFLGGIAFVVGFLRTPWVPLALLLCILLAAAGLVPAGVLGTGLAVASSVLGVWSLYRKFEAWSPGRRGSRWNQRSAAGWVVCLLVAGLLEARGLAAYGGHFKIAGMAVGAALLVLLPGARIPAGPASGKGSRTRARTGKGK
jgi:hypothetical protein